MATIIEHFDEKSLVEGFDYLYLVFNRGFM